MPDEKIVKKTTVVNYAGNSHKDKAAPEEAKSEEKLEKVATGEVKTRKKSLGRRITENFAGEDMGSVGQYILFDVLIPAAKTAISDAVGQGIERALFGDSRPRSSSRSGSHVSYNRMYSGGSRPAVREEPRRLSTRARAEHDFREIVLETRGDAEAVIDRLADQIREYDVATVSDMYDLVGITGSFTDNKWGWNDLRDARIRRVREGYLLDLPAPIQMD